MNWNHLATVVQVNWELVPAAMGVFGVLIGALWHLWNKRLDEQTAALREQIRANERKIEALQGEDRNAVDRVHALELKVAACQACAVPPRKPPSSGP